MTLIQLLRPALVWLLAFVPVSFSAQKALFSGPQPGERIEPFKVLAVNGPDAGKEVDYVTSYGQAPMLLVFLHQIDRNVGALVAPAEKFARERAPAGLRTLIVYLAPDKIEGERRMRAVIGSLRLEVPVGVSLDGVEGPGAYGLNREVAVTVLVAKDRSVTDNLAIVQPGTVDAPRVIAAAARHVGGHVPTAEEIQAERTRMAPRNPSPSMATGGMAAEPDPPELASLLRSLIQPSNTREAVDEAVRQLRAWAGSDPKRRAQLGQKMGVIIPLRYGTEFARSRMAELQAEMAK